MDELGYEKGLKLEKLIVRIFRNNGYDVIHNTKIKGRSGVEHQIDVYAEYKCPLHTSKIVIECKAYDKPINKDVVMKLIQEVLDLGVDRGILVTTSYFTPDAVATAEGYNIDLWDYTKLKEYMGDKSLDHNLNNISNIYFVVPKISVRDSKK